MREEYTLNDLRFTPKELTQMAAGTGFDLADMDDEMRRGFQSDREDAENLLRDFEKRATR